MTTPTQAQIEAAAMAIDEEAFSMPDDLTPSERMYWEANKPVRQAIARERATAALTAAAEVRVPEQEHILQKHGQKSDLLPSGNTAAEVGDELESGVLLTKAIDEVIAEDIEKERLQELVSQGIQIERQLRKELLTLRATTIERCAQVAKASIIKNWGVCPVPSALADAVDADLRALKET